jgi:hypothetical protein
MPPRPKGPFILALLIITVGVGWLLTVKGIAPGINWVWTLGLGMVGILTFIVSGGVDKASVVIGPMFLLSSGLSILRQQEQLSMDTEVPILVIAVGVLLLIAQMRAIPSARWLAASANLAKD